LIGGRDPAARQAKARPRRWTNDMSDSASAKSRGVMPRRFRAEIDHPARKHHEELQLRTRLNHASSRAAPRFAVNRRQAAAI
jgi:hypothetical protein